MNQVTNQIKNDKYNGIDLFKFILSIIVIAGHTNPLKTCTNEIILRIYSNSTIMAVPFFFLASGYLLGVKMKYPYSSENDVTVIKTYLYKIINIYIIWTVIYLPLTIYKFIDSDASLVTSILLFIRGLLLIGENYNSWILWYLLSAIYGLIFIIFMLKRKVSPEKIIIYGFLLFLLGCCCNVLTEYKGSLPRTLLLMKKVILYTISNGRIFRGAFYISFGMFLSYKRIPVTLNWLFFILGFILKYFIHLSISSSILNLVCVMGLFGIVESLRLKDSKVYPYIRKMSTVIYFIHLYIWTFYYKLVYSQKTYGLDCFLVTTLCCLLISSLYVFAMNRRKSRAVISKIIINP